MLTDLHIRHFAIIDESHLELEGGLSALTGETGAGKSILLDALGLVLGDRASSHLVQQGRQRAEITAVFSLENQADIQLWLQEADLDTDDECILRRTINASGKSTASINGTPVALAQLKSLGQRLIAIHGQHAHQSLARSASQRQLLDRFAPSPLLDRVSRAFESWAQAQGRLDDFLQARDHHQQRLDLLSFQLREFDELDMAGLPVGALEEEHRWRANAEELMSLCARISDALDSRIEPGLASVTRDLEAVVSMDDSVREALDLVESAAIQSHEASSLINRRLSALDHDDARLEWLDSRLGELHRLAKKHQCRLDELDDREQALRDEFDALTQPEASEEELVATRDACLVNYTSLAQKLSRHRQTQGRKLGKLITDSLQSLNMTGASFSVEVASSERRPEDPSEPKGDDSASESSAKANTRQVALRPSPHGNDLVRFLVSTNPGVSPAPLSKIASGGELSRISLCIQLATIGSHGVPTLIFDEVDAGIGGAVAETVGRLLRQVGGHAQVLCVTHLPQVAAQAHHHLQVTKSVSGGKTTTRVQRLNRKQTQEEIARMLGGARLTAQSRKHAREMLDAVELASND